MYILFSIKLFEIQVSYKNNKKKSYDYGYKLGKIVKLYDISISINCLILDNYLNYI